MKKYITVLLAAYFLFQPGKTAAQFEALQELSGMKAAPKKEKIFVHTDKSFYHAGEVLWFSMFLADASTDSLCNGSSIVYAELLDGDNAPVLQGKIRAEDGKGQGSFILPLSIASGNYRFRAYTAWMKNLPPDAYFHKDITVINMHTPGVVNTGVASAGAVSIVPGGGRQGLLRISAATDKTRYGTRDKVRLTVSTDSTTQGFTGRMSVSVFRIDSLVTPDASGISDYMDITQEAVTPKEQLHLPETDDHLVTGMIRDKRTGAPAPGVVAYLSAPGPHAQFYHSTSDSTGKVLFSAKRFFGGGEVIVQTNPLTAANYAVELADPFSKKYSDIPHQRFVFPSSYPLTLRKQNISAQVQHAFYTSELNRMWLSHDDTAKFFGRGEEVYNLDDYTRFTAMEEVLREFVFGVGVKNVGGSARAFIYNAHTKQPFDSMPLILLDGIPVFDMKKLMAYDPLKVQQMQVVPKKYFRGNQVYYGILNITTAKGNAEGYEPDLTASVLDYAGLQMNRRFYMPDHGQQSPRAKRLPDFRNVLYWSPDVFTRQDHSRLVEFYTSDLKGTYAIVIHGMTQNGRTGTHVGQFTVE